jgi:hypothetical protein
MNKILFIMLVPIVIIIVLLGFLLLNIGETYTQRRLKNDR